MKVPTTKFLSVLFAALAAVVPAMAQELYEAIGKLEELNPMMPAFEGTDEERKALAGWLDKQG